MEEEIRKRNTDCVYFLASPFTCKKGSRCEYRHSESARLNPRDCWYWLRGNCLIPSCGFRHPPFEVLTRPLSEQSYGALSSGKANIPCYFYRHAHCMKGDQCLFLHDILPAPKLSAVAPEATMAHSVGKVASAGKDKGPPSGKLPAIIRPKDTSELIKQNQCKEVSQQPEPCPSLEEQALSVDSISESKEHAIILPESCPHFCLDRSAGELAEDCFDTEDVTNPVEQLEITSPGFDVLVDDESEQLADEDDAKNQLAQEGESEIPYHHNFLYDFQELNKSDFPDYEFLYGSYDHVDLYERELEFSRERISERMLGRKRKPPYTAYENDARDCGHLQGNLRKRSRSDSEILHSFWPGYDTRGRLVSHEMGWRHRRKLVLESPKIAIISPLYPKKPQKKRRKKAHRRRGTNRSSRSDKDMKLTSPLVKSATADFSGPKTLAQIKEENGRGNSSGSGPGINIHQCSRSHLSNDFDWPRSLNGLLKGKQRPQSIDGNYGSDVFSDIGNEQIANGNVEKDYGEYSFLSKTHNGDDADYEEVDLQKKLAEIFRK